MIFSTRARAITLRGISILYFWVIAVLFVHAVVDRFHLPLMPFSDPDTWGYLFPGVSLLSGGGFVHTAGRGFPYPLFVCGILKVFGDFRYISIVQHTLGLLAGGLLVLTWERGLRFFRPGPVGWIVHRVLGWTMVGCFLGARTSVLLEHSIRPESIFPFFTILAACLGTEYAIAFWQKKNLRLSFFIGLFLVFDSLFVYFLKPAWGFGTGFAMLPVLVSLLQLRGRYLYKVAILAIPLVIAAAGLWYPEKVLVEKYDKTSDEFLPSLLMFFNAPAVRNEMAAELNGTRPLAYDRQLVQMAMKFIDAELNAPHRTRAQVLAAGGELTHAGAKKYLTYTVLGYDPDNLLYRHDQPTCLMVELSNRFGDDTAGYAAFCMHYYKAAWAHQPAAMVHKIWAQLWAFYSMSSSPFGGRGDKIEIIKQVPRTLGSVDLNEKRLPAFVNYIKTVRGEAGSTQIWKEKRTVSREQKFFHHIYLPAFCFSILLSILVWVKRDMFSAFAEPGLWTLYLFGFNLGNVLTIAVVHTVQVGRYVQNQLIFTLIAECAGALLLVVVAERLLTSRYCKHAEPAAQAGERPAVAA